MKTVVGTVLEINLNTPVKKRDGGTYPGWQLTYRSQDGKIEEVAKHVNTLKYQPNLKAGLESLQKGDTFTLGMEKGESGYWEVMSIAKGEEMPAPTAKPTTEAPQRKYRSDATEADKVRQTSIIRQSSLKSAVEALGPGKKPDDYIKLAKTFEAYASGVDKSEEAVVE